MRWLVGFTNSMDGNLSKLREMESNKETVHGIAGLDMTVWLNDNSHHPLDLCKLKDVYSVSSSIYPCYLHVTLEGLHFLLLLSPSLLSST